MNNNMNPNTIKSNIDKGIKKYCRWFKEKLNGYESKLNNENNKSIRNSSNGEKNSNCIDMRGNRFC
jgi:hypothetical protein